MVFGVIYAQFSTFLSCSKFWFTEVSYFWVIFSTLYADFQYEFSTPHPGPKASLVHWGNVNLWLRKGNRPNFGLVITYFKLRLCSLLHGIHASSKIVRWSRNCQPLLLGLYRQGNSKDQDHVL